jgi:hypothetical protein
LKLIGYRSIAALSRHATLVAIGWSLPPWAANLPPNVLVGLDDGQRKS